MATDRSHRVIMEKYGHSRAFFFDWIFILAGNEDTIKSHTSLKLGQIRPHTAELAALECLENPHRLIVEEMWPLWHLHFRLDLQFCW